MTYQELLELKNTRAEKMKEGAALLEKKDFAAHKLLMEEVGKLNPEIEATEKQLAEEGRFADGDEKMKALALQKQKQKEEEGVEKSVDDIRAEPEYARTWAKALSESMTVKTSRGVEGFGILHKALTVSGGTPAGEEGGFLVPKDFDNAIIQETKDYLDLSTLFNVESVTTYSGWRAVETAGQRTKLSLVGENTAIGKANQPKFTKVDYTVKKYGDRLVVSSELMDDNTAGLIQYLAQWFGPKYILTKNDLLLSILNSLTFTAQTATTDKDKVKAIKNILNTKLNTAYSRGAVLLTNQNGYDEMDNWVDGQNRPMLVPDVSGDFSRIKGRQVLYADNDLIGTKSVTDGSVTTEYDPLYIGNYKAAATLFLRKAMEVAATNVGGDAWANDAYELRCLCRMDAQKVDEAAVYATGYAQSGAQG
ncbi:phage major capsid protein [Oscillibacter sp.]|uniref:phage major capsid protein n=1 Tax=Oscillibacter sp. TaxID=1945593 RepID=UPI00289BC989|nr:phage major capsid protein [Oscillibacter sp.]